MSSQILTHFAKRHIGISSIEKEEMLKTIGVGTLDQLIDETVPAGIRMQKKLNLPEALQEHEYLAMLKKIGSKNKVFKSYIGQGYYNTLIPAVILRNVFENPGWYTQYTPYQAEIAQGRLEALLNFQTMITDLTALPIANASLLDEGTAAAEAMAMCEGIHNKKRKTNPAKRFFVDQKVYRQTLDVIITRARPLHIEVVIGDWQTFEFSDDYFGVLIQYPNSEGNINDYQSFAASCNAKEIQVIVAADIMSLALLTPPGEWGADVVVGNTQRFGVPKGYGGPHAAFFATKEDNKRLIPGRIIGLSVDINGDPALRMALQTREQHIRREKATSNICTAQALLSIMASMYAVYHGPDGIKEIASGIHKLTAILAGNLKSMNVEVINDNFFDTITIKTDADLVGKIKSVSESEGINFFYPGNDKVSISLDESVNLEDVKDICKIFASVFKAANSFDGTEKNHAFGPMARKSDILTHPVFSMYHTESKMMRYIKSLENKDLSLVHSMISLGSCTMKLNAASEMIPVSWPEFSSIHPFAPEDQTLGYQQIFAELEAYLAEITGFDACSLQPNSGAQGEYAGLLTIRAYHQDRNELSRNIALIPSSAHGTNPASAVMCGMEVVVIGCDEKGNVDMDDLRLKAEQHSNNLSCLMITYPSTHGVFETSIKEICDLIHHHGGLVYMDGANMNAQVGLTSPGIIGADVCHLNLHKTFAIPHGGGGPGMGPICVNKKLAPFLPGHTIIHTGGSKAIPAVSSAPWGSASILLISYGYIRMLGAEGVTNATKYAILNANYIKSRLDGAYHILYSGENGRAAHEMIVDLRQFKDVGISAEDIAKRLMDYGFHAPTLSFPVAGTIMIEPTESEDKGELDRFCDALLEIRKEIDQVALGEMDATSNVLTNAPHTSAMVCKDEWNFTYSREKAAFPLPYLRHGNKFWPSVARVDGAFGDRNLVCICPPLESYMNH
ncbi:MAG: aminomethyl-transferring glycine dehydrogenase [Saprospiraceae bacterium]|nr:aminomethyl-transferring glycine dehydrogenase [Saprospiraceae bacterium]